MKTYHTQFKVVQYHLDQGDHMNWRKQLGTAEALHFLFRDELGIGLTDMKQKHDLFLVMGNIKDVFYRRQLRLHDTVDVEMTVWVSSLARLEFHCIFFKDEEVATEMSWVMPLVSATNGRPKRIPLWMKNILEIGKTESRLKVPA